MAAEKQANHMCAERQTSLLSRSPRQVELAALTRTHGMSAGRGGERGFLMPHGIHIRMLNQHARPCVSQHMQREKEALIPPYSSLHGEAAACTVV